MQQSRGVGRPPAGQTYVIQPWDRFNPPTLAKYSAFAAANTLIGGVGYIGNELQGSTGVAVAPRSGDLYAIDYDDGANEFILVFKINPQFTKVIGQIGLSNGQFFSGIAVDDAGQVYVGRTGATGGAVPNSVEVFSAAASGRNPAPSRIIAGPNTDLSDPVAITLMECAPHRGRR